MLSIGDSAPQFTLQDQDGSKKNSTDFLGGWILMYFYPKDNTPGCTTEACGIRDSWDQFKKAGITVIGVSADSVSSHQKFIANHSLPFVLLSDPDKEVIKRYGALGEKQMFGKKYLGILRISYLIDPKGIVRQVYKKVQPRKHAAEILKDFAALQK